MCAIIGQIGGKINKKIFIEARDSMKHRGPDGEGVYYGITDEVVALGHRRLAILDLSLAGNQPMFSHDKRFVVVFNGEIFNFIELKKELSEFKFKTGTDTEVLLAAYQKWGKSCLLKFNGQFAFAIYDTREKELFCARDNFGIKPFYYSFENGVFKFASEIKALIKLGVGSQPNDKIIFEYLRHAFYDHSKETFFKGINRLMPGECAVWKKNKLTIKTYWDLALLKDKENQYDNISRTDALDLFKTLMADAIRLQFRSDAPVGLNVSSGLDSMSMLFFANSLMGEQLRLFSAGLADADYDEVKYLKNLLSKKQKNFLYTSKLTPEKTWWLKDRLTEIQDEPYGGFSTINYFNLYEETGILGVKVLLEGQGADEILGGYKYYETGGRENNISQDLTREGEPGIIDSKFALKFKDLKTDFPKPFKSDLLNMQYRDIKYIKMPRVLRFNDHISMAYGRELRVPYLDYRLAEFCFFLPKRLKMEDGRFKTLLRDSMEGIVPDEGKNKPKFFFGAFQTKWLRRHFKKEVYDIINSPSFKNRPYWNSVKVKEKVDEFFSGKGDNSFFLWQLLDLEAWFRKYIDD
ncbi:MAG: asparagine synthase (glutamine-hydrolyzing) [Minisyncoccia bacterium]